MATPALGQPAWPSSPVVVQPSAALGEGVIEAGQEPTEGDGLEDDDADHAVEDEAFDLGEGDDAFDFGDPAPEERAGRVPLSDSPTGSVDLSALFRSHAGLWLSRDDRRPTSLARARQQLDLTARYRRREWRATAAVHGEYDLAYQLDRDRYPAPMVRAYELVVEPRELFASWSPGRFTISVGRQIIGWGEGLLISHLDVLVPRDTREPGLTDWQDSRLPVAATRVTVGAGSLQLDVGAVHETNWGHRPPPYGWWSPLPEVFPQLEGREVVWQHEPGAILSSAGQQPFARALYAGHGFDLGFHAAWPRDQPGVVRIPTIDPDPGARVTLGLEHPRYGLLGVSGAIPFRAIVIKSELAVQLGRPYAYDASEVDLPRTEVDRSHLVVGLLGVHYIAPERLVAIELAGGLDSPGRREGALALDHGLLAARGSQKVGGLPFRVEATMAVAGLLAQAGWFLRAEVAWEVRPSIIVRSGYVGYGGGSDYGPFTGLDRNHQVLASLTWDVGIL